MSTVNLIIFACCNIQQDAHYEDNLKEIGWDGMD
jgi:hypothetical protein